MRQHTAGTMVLLLAFAAVIPAMLGPSRADACIPIPNATGLTEMDGRRAVIWIRDQSFQIIFQNQYSGSAADFAWVIPLPGVPSKVDQSSEKFLDVLNKYTAPMVENRSCYEPCPHRGPPDGGTPSGGNVVPPEVTLWGSGTLGDLEYQVLGATSSDALVAWLQTHGYQLDTSLKPLIESYLSQGAAFFAAKIAAGATVPAVVPAVRFTFDRNTTSITYPLRISAFNRSAPLPTALWVIAKDGTFLPSNFPTARVTASEHTLQSLATEEETLMAGGGGRTFVIEYADQGQGDYRRQMLYYQYGSTADPEMQEIFSENLYVVRLRASLNPKGTNEDLALQMTPSPEKVGGWFMTPCPGGLQPNPECRPPVAGDMIVPLPKYDAGPSTQPRETGPGTSGQQTEGGGGCAIEHGGEAAPPWGLLACLAAGLLWWQRRRC